MGIKPKTNAKTFSQDILNSKGEVYLMPRSGGVIEGQLDCWGRSFTATVKTTVPLYTRAYLFNSRTSYEYRPEPLSIIFGV